MSGRDSTKAALNRYFERELEKSNRVPRRNEKPEFEFRKVAVRWLKANGWSINVVESRAVYNFEAGRYDHGQTDTGFSDLVGVTPYFGVACFIELKAPGKRSTIRFGQHIFLTEKIEAGAFACCADSIEVIEKTFKIWRRLRESKLFGEAVAYLKSSLPTRPSTGDRLEDIFKE